ncbi:hypothetical protein GTQ99_00555 [Kineococcus sp. T13]|uniref:hypothetical protein n=1 Tax=Kineococcus vitellinus TaxID=2696565 RepID=UPI001412144C|nr:hypothetical protein [Kineococcus vitellinus]NAZ73922.1 hypothetical protein [Kineococcus vitellinus]
MNLEVFHGRGVRLVSTDSYMLAHVFVPYDTFDPTQPEIEETPDESYIVKDANGRGLGLMKFIEKQIRAWRKREEDPDIEGELMLSIANVESAQATLEGMNGRAMRMEWPDRELVQCPLVEDSEFVQWRQVDAAVAPVGEPDRVALSADFLRDIAKIGSHYPGAPVQLEINGSMGAVRFTLGECRGLLMPIRVSEDEQIEPAEQTEEDADAALEFALAAEQESNSDESDFDTDDQFASGAYGV